MIRNCLILVVFLLSIISCDKGNNPASPTFESSGKINTLSETELSWVIEWDCESDNWTTKEDSTWSVLYGHHFIFNFDGQNLTGSHRLELKPQTSYPSAGILTTSEEGNCTISSDVITDSTIVRIFKGKITRDILYVLSLEQNNVLYQINRRYLRSDGEYVPSMELVHYRDFNDLWNYEEPKPKGLTQVDHPGLNRYYHLHYLPVNFSEDALDTLRFIMKDDRPHIESVMIQKLVEIEVPEVINVPAAITRGSIECKDASKPYLNDDGVCVGYTVEIPTSSTGSSSGSSTRSSSSGSSSSGSSNNQPVVYGSCQSPKKGIKFCLLKDGDPTDPEDKLRRIWVNDGDLQNFSMFIGGDFNNSGITNLVAYPKFDVTLRINGQIQDVNGGVNPVYQSRYYDVITAVYNVGELGGGSQWSSLWGGTIDFKGNTYASGNVNYSLSLTCNPCNTCVECEERDFDCANSSDVAVCEEEEAEFNEERRVCLANRNQCLASRSPSCDNNPDNKANCNKFGSVTFSDGFTIAGGINPDTAPPPDLGPVDDVIKNRDLITWADPGSVEEVNSALTGSRIFQSRYSFGSSHRIHVKGNPKAAFSMKVESDNEAVEPQSVLNFSRSTPLPPYRVGLIDLEHDHSQPHDLDSNDLNVNHQNDHDHSRNPSNLDLGCIHDEPNGRAHSLNPDDSSPVYDCVECTQDSHCDTGNFCNENNRCEEPKPHTNDVIVKIIPDLHQRSSPQTVTLNLSHNSGSNLYRDLNTTATFKLEDNWPDWTLYDPNNSINKYWGPVTYNVSGIPSSGFNEGSSYRVTITLTPVDRRFWPEEAEFEVSIVGDGSNYGYYRTDRNDLQGNPTHSNDISFNGTKVDSVLFEESNSGASKSLTWNLTITDDTHYEADRRIQQSDGTFIQGDNSNVFEHGKVVIKLKSYYIEDVNGRRKIVVDHLIGEKLFKIRDNESKERIAFDPAVLAVPYTSNRAAKTVRVKLGYNPPDGINTVVTAREDLEYEVEPSSLTFTSRNWNSYQSVRIRRKDNAGNHQYIRQASSALEFEIDSSGRLIQYPVYDTIGPLPRSVSITTDDGALTALQLLSSEGEVHRVVVTDGDDTVITLGEVISLTPRTKDSTILGVSYDVPGPACTLRFPRTDPNGNCYNSKGLLLAYAKKSRITVTVNNKTYTSSTYNESAAIPGSSTRTGMWEFSTPIPQEDYHNADATARISY